VPPIQTPYVPRSKFHVRIPSLGSYIQRIRPGQRLFVIFRNRLVFTVEGLLGPHPTPKLEDNPLSFVRGCLFSIFAATFHSWKPSLHPQPEDAPCCGDKRTHRTSSDFAFSLSGLAKCAKSLVSYEESSFITLLCRSCSSSL
jgi:hypothetical protein